MNAEVVDEEFFDQGQALNQIDRASLVEVARDEVKRKIMNTMIAHLLWDLANGLAIFIYWSKLQSYSCCDDNISFSLKRSLCQCWITIYAPFVIAKIYLLSMKDAMSTLKFK